MTQLPEFLQPFEAQAKEYLAKDLVRDIEFSGKTYQVQVVDASSGKTVWAFIQLDPRGSIKDCFCSCEQGEEFNHCEHLAAAFTAIYNNHSNPLHERFQESLWYKLSLLFAQRIGEDSEMLTAIRPGYYVNNSVGRKIIFSAKGKTPAGIARLKSILEDRKEETEETSLKFSNLSEDELDQWRQGKPSGQLRYELSFWNDFAHWLMQLQERKSPYSITFGYSSTQIPNQITIEFPDIAMSFYLSEANLPQIIPALATVQSPLAIHHATEEAIDSISYDKKNGSLLITAKDANSAQKPSKKKKSNSKPSNENSMVIGDWIYFPNDGFYARGTHQLLSSPRIEGQEIAVALNDHSRTIQKLLEGCTLHLEPLTLSYTLAFDAEWNLHITAYALTPGDLTTPYSRYYGDWIYLDDDGFYPVSEQHFDSLETTIPANEVADFVRRERSWLNTQEHFHAHLTSLEAQLTYSLSPQNRLSFARLLPSMEERGESKDFGAWVYVARQGFFAKVSSHTSLPLQPDIAIQADQIPLFIRMNRAELQLVPRFFSEKCPVAKAGLNIELGDNELISVTPEYDLLPEYKDKDVRLFDDFAYTGGEGFHELPIDNRLPERFRHPTHIDANDMALFLTYELNNLKPHAKKIDPRLLPPQKLKLTATNIAKSNEQEKGWYALKLKYQTEQGSIPLSYIWSGIKQKKRFLFSDAGLIDLASANFDWIRHIPKRRLDNRSNILQMSTLELIRLNALEEISVDSDDELSESLLKELTEFHIPNEPDLTGLTSNLRPYQQIGSHWMWFLYHHGLSGLLCDDMGLGKTHQAMALLCAVYNRYRSTQSLQESPRHGPHFLIVCPTSVIYHWQEKLEAFLPHLRICTFYGSTRSLDAFHQQYDVLLTSYGIWRIENELLSEMFFEVAIFDEIQIAKNQNSRVNASLRNANARMRLGLTGTPIENHLRELKALFDIALPGYMPNDAEFRELFVKPIEKQNDPSKKSLLSRFIKPFVLRRKKEEVLPDLPEKTEEIAHCTLLPAQQSLYNEVLHQSRQHIMEQMHQHGSSIPYIHIFALLSSLKQICNHPAAYLKIPSEYNNYESGKWELFVELLNEARESQQKVVVFTQYLAMLDIFEDYLNEIGIGYATIRGATVNRGEQVHRFNHDPSCEVFLGSLQASGLGVDLTAGSVVIHYDRWWNAARENQATDRVHRIGQTRGVQVFKLVTKGTFEDRIDALISKKGRLMEDVVGTDDHRFLKKFSRDEILQLLQDVEEAK